MKIKDIIQYLETVAPLAYQEKYDNAGLIVGNAETTCTKALLCLDSIEEVVEEAIELECNLIIAHHPIIFKGLKKLTGSNYIEKTIIKAIKNDIAIYAAHTNLDNVITGVNRKICEKIGLVNCNILDERKQVLKKIHVICPLAYSDHVRMALMRVGAGNIGDYYGTSYSALGVSTFQQGAAASAPVSMGVQPGEMKIELIFPIHLEAKVLAALKEAHPYKERANHDVFTLDNAYRRIGSGMIGELPEAMNPTEFLKSLKETMNTDCIRHTQLLRKKIKRIAVCGGTGVSLLSKAMAQKADVFITADFKYHQFFDANNKVIVADIGHYESEQFTVELFQELLSKKFSNFETVLSKVNTNPIKYL